jgi:hypothetical protein
MSKARLVIISVTVEKRPVSEVAKSYGVARSWVYTLLARYQAEGEAAFEPRSRRPKTSPTAISQDTVELITRIRKELARQGLVTPDPSKRPKSSYIRFEADVPNECWQSDFTTRSPAARAPRS